MVVCVGGGGWVGWFGVGFICIDPQDSDREQLEIEGDGAQSVGLLHPLLSSRECSSVCQGDRKIKLYKHTKQHKYTEQKRG